MTRKTGPKPPIQLVLPSSPFVDITPHETSCRVSHSPERGPLVSSNRDDLPARRSPRIPSDDSPSPKSVSNRTPSLTPLLRCLIAAGGLFLIAGFCLAFRLEPSPRGYGTHQQLGLPPCSIQFLFGIPCPSCGMTTSFAWYIRGQWGLAWQANPAGFYLAVLCTLLIPWSLISAAGNRLRGVRRLEHWGIGLLVPFVLIAVAQWLMRL